MDTEAHGNAADGMDVGWDVIVVGGGQAGLAMAWHLTQRGLRFLVLDHEPGIPSEPTQRHGQAPAGR
jgi:flavin-dependent dehydrogenase